MAIFEVSAPPAAHRVHWSDRSVDRAVPRLDLPRLDEVAGPEILDGQRRLAAFFVARVVAGLAGFLVAFQQRSLVGAAAATWIVYGGSLTAVHHLIHGSLGLSPRARRFWLTAMAAVVTESGHALRSTHLLHHRTDPDTPDPEGYIEHVAWRRMPIEAVRFRYRLMGWGLAHGGPQRRIRAEVAAHVVAHVVALVALPVTWWPAAYLGAIAVASGGFALMAGKGPQTNWGRAVATPLVRVRTRLLRPILFSHDRHLEHHAYPQVPLPRLRLLDDALAPAMGGLDVVEVHLP